MKKYVTWFCAAFVITIVFGTIFGSVQQALRLSANDPQIQMAQDTAQAIENGVLIKDAVTGQINLNKSLAPAIMVYDRTGQVMGGSAMLDGEIPTMPIGVLKNSDGKKYHAVTWQPNTNLRFASVTVATDAYYVTAVCSLNEIESRIARISVIVLIGWLISLLSLVVLYVVKNYEPIKKEVKAKLK